MGSQVVGLLGGWRPTPLSPPTSASTCWARRHVVVLVCRLAVLRLGEPCTLRFSCSRHARQSSAQLVVLITSFRRRIWLDAPAAVATADDCLRRRSLRKRSATTELKVSMLKERTKERTERKKCKKEREKERKKQRKKERKKKRKKEKEKKRKEKNRKEKKRKEKKRKEKKRKEKKR